jgi:hypothetical protein
LRKSSIVPAALTRFDYECKISVETTTNPVKPRPRRKRPRIALRLSPRRRLASERRLPDFLYNSVGEIKEIAAKNVKNYMNYYLTISRKHTNKWLSNK